jgi:hypothetical protein
MLRDALKIKRSKAPLRIDFVHPAKRRFTKHRFGLTSSILLSAASQSTASD